jgi:hypothetical protein
MLLLCCLQAAAGGAVGWQVFDHCANAGGECITLNECIKSRGLLI